MKEAGSNILNIESLSVGFINGRETCRLLPPVSAGAACGELVAIIGINGIGKSTLLRTIARLQPPLGGKIEIDGIVTGNMSRNEFARNMGYVSTEPVTASNMTVTDLVALGRYPHTNWFGRIEDEDQDVINDAIEKAGLRSLRDRFVASLSDGERQRAMIARVLAQDTRILILDEPTAFLDVNSKYEIIHLLRELTRKRNKTILFSTHDLQAALSQADRIWLMLKDGLREGAPEDLMLDDAFDLLFEKSVVKFDSRHGSFVMNCTAMGEVSLEGKGKEKYWTSRALIRAGFTVGGENGKTVVKVLPGRRWTVDSVEGHFECSSIYQLTDILIRTTANQL